MSRNKESVVRVLEMIGAGAAIAGIFQSQALLGFVVTVLAMAMVVSLNNGEKDGK